MKVYRAETGKKVSIPNLQGVDSLDALKFELEHATQVPVASQILMTSFGTQLKQEMVAEAVQATGKDEYIVIVYDRHYLDAPAESIAALTESESPEMEPPITLPNGSSLAALRTKRATSKLTLQQHCDLYLALFRAHDALSQTYVQTTTSHYHLASDLASEQRIQSMALTVAQSNLDAHVSSAAQAHDAFTVVAGREFTRQAANLAGADADVEALRRVRVHHGMLEAMTVDGKKVEAKEGAVLAEFVDLREVVEARERAEEQYEALVAQTRELRERLGGIQQGAEGLRRQGTGDVDLNSVDAVAAEVKESLVRVTGIREKIQRDLIRVQDKISELLPSSHSTASTSTLPSTSPPGLAGFSAPAHLPSHARKTFEAFDHLAEIHLRDYLRELAAGETQAREGVLYLTKSKAKMIDVFARQMNTVSHLQSAIAGVVPRLRGLEQGVKALRKEVEEGALGGVKRVVAAYGALMIELVRRKEYASILLENASTLADLLAHFRSQEQRRREAFRSDLSKALPFGIDGIEDSPPYTEISTPGLRNRLPEVGKEEVRDFLSFLRTTYATATTPASPAFEPASLSSRRAPSDRGRSMSRGPSGGAPVPAQQQVQLPESGARDKILQALGKMNRQVDGMRAEFVKGVEKRYFSDRPLPSRTTSTDDYSGSRRDSYSIREVIGDASQAGTQPLSPLREDLEADALLMQKSRALETAEERIKNYESRIKSLEETLQRTYRASSQLLRPPSPSISSSTYSIVDAAEDANGKVDPTAKAETWRIRCAELERRVEELQRERKRDQAETDERLAGERVKADELQLLLEEERRAAREEKETAAREWEERAREWEDRAREWVVVAEQTEQIKEDLRAQIVELEGLLDEERQTFEENRMSLLREVQTQAHLAERRIADVEVEWKDRIVELEQALDQQQNENTQRMTYHEQLLRSQREEHEHALATQLATQRQDEETRRESERAWKGKVAEREIEIEEARRIWTEEREKLVAQIEGLRMEMNNSEEAREDIKQRLAQARKMVAHAEKDWTEKNEALEKMTTDFEETRRLTLDCLRLIETPETPPEERAQGQDNMNDMLHKLMGNITRITAAKDGLEQSLNVSHDRAKQLELELVAERERTADEARRRAEAETLATDLAAQLHSYHSNVTDGLVKGLKLEKEVVAALEATVETKAEAEGTERTPREMLEVAKKVNVGEVVRKVKRKILEKQEAVNRKWEKPYTAMKEKYIAESEKIAFRNFKVNDVALFLPTRNSTGKPWAAFNIHAPHYFLKATDRVSDQLATREWIVARIVSMTECVVDSKIPDSNPYGLADGIKFYQLEGESWSDKAHKSSRNRSSSSRDDGQLSPSSSTTSRRSSANLLSNSAMMSSSGVMSRSQVDALQTDAPALTRSIIGSGGLTSPVSPTSTPSVIRRASTIPVVTDAGPPNMSYDTVSSALTPTRLPAMPPQSRASSGTASAISPASSPFKRNSLTAALPTLPTQQAQSILSASTPSLARRAGLANNGSPPSPITITSSRPVESDPMKRESTPPTSRYGGDSPSLASSEFLSRENANEYDPANIWPAYNR